MNKKTIITALLALVALAGQGQTFTPVQEDSINFVITGTTISPHDSVAWFQCAPMGCGGVVKVPLVDGTFRIAGRLPRNAFVQIGDYAGNDLHFIVEEMPTNINLITGEV